MTDTARGSCAVPTPAEALATVRQALASQLAREEAAHACPTCCVAVFFRNGEPGSDPQPGEELWRPGLVPTQAHRDWLRAAVCWRQGARSAPCLRAPRFSTPPALTASTTPDAAQACPPWPRRLPCWPRGCRREAWLRARGFVNA